MTLSLHFSLRQINCCLNFICCTIRFLTSSVQTAPAKIFFPAGLDNASHLSTRIHFHIFSLEVCTLLIASHLIMDRSFYQVGTEINSAGLFDRPAIHPTFPCPDQQSETLIFLLFPSIFSRTCSNSSTEIMAS